MARYDTYTRFDDRMLEDLDMGFVGFNNRLRPDQLPRGVLADSKNGRMDQNGEWQTRKGMDNIIAPLATGGSALTLPFTLDDSGTPPQLNDTAVNAVYGSCIFSDPNDDTESYIILAANTKAVAIKVSDPSTTYDLNYPSGESISSPVSMIQAFNKLFIFREGDTPFEKDLSATNINTSPSLEKVDSGEFSQPKQLSPTRVDITDGKATATFSSLAAMNGLDVGDVFVVETTGSPTTFTVGSEFTVAARDDTAFTVDFFVQLADASNVTGVIFQQHVSIGLGFTHMPAPEYGVYHQRRLAVPYRYSVDTSFDTYTDRKIFDEILLSDILDTDTYDQVYGQFRFNAGKSDFNVGMHSFSDDKLIVFNRNSIHIVVGSGSIANATAQLLTDEVGLLARDSVVQVGNQVLFLSDNGVYGMNFIDLYNLRGNDVPLSESINKTIKDIDKDNASKAVGAYFDNKYYLALPTKTFSDGSTNSDGINNILLIYNFLNKSWESIDTVNNVDTEGNTISRFDFNNLLVAGKGANRGVYVTNTDGGVHKLEVYDDGIDRVITDIGGTQKSTTVQGSATTRMFTLGSIDRKKFNNFELHLQSSDDSSSDCTILATTENIDSEPALDLTPGGTVGTTYGPFKNADGNEESDIPPGEDVSIRGRIGNKRAYGLQMTLTSTSGRPRFRSLKVAGAETFRSTSSVQ